MSVDIVDDLHAAEDRIGLLEVTLQRLVDAVDTDEDVGSEYGDALDTARGVLAARYERPSCDEDCDDEFCGSPRHYDQEFNETTGEWEDA
jgi:hypothetical protein